jgi:serine/threonine protein kinase
MNAQPTRIGRYEIERELGRGATSVVYLANDQALRRKLALKVLPHYLTSDPAFVQRFNREAQVVGRLSHPNIVTMFDIGEDQGSHYIAFEYVDGQSVTQLLRAQPQGVPVSEAVRICLEVARALEYAHSRGIIHRDVKPGNVLLDASGRVSLTDFGIAVESEPNRAITATGGAIVGTPGYMAPEVIQGKVVDGRADIYSLGALFYHLLTGSRPFEGEGDVNMLIRALSESPAPPSTLREGVPPEIDAIALKALAPDPEHRFQSAVEFVAAVSSYSGALSPEANWPIWRTTIERLLLQYGRVQGAEIERVVPISHVAYALQRFVQESGDLDVTETPGGLELRRARLHADLNDAWSWLRDLAAPVPSLQDLLTADGKKSTLVDISDRLVHVVQRLVDVLGTSYTPLGGERVDVDFFPTAFTLDTRKAFQGTALPSAMTLLFTLREGLDDQDLLSVREALAAGRGPAQRFALLIATRSYEAATAIRETCERLRRVHGLEVAVLSHRDVRRIVAAREPVRALRKAIFSQVSLVAVSPFVTSGPVPDHAFFGRETDLQQIGSEVRTKSFVLVGGRRIGKSSVLARLHRVRLPAAGYRAVYHDCSVTPSFGTFVQARPHAWVPPLDPPGLPTFGEVLASPPGDRPLVLLLDEADKLVPSERAGRWAVFSALRTFVNSGKGQVVLSGERILLEAIKDAGSPLFNLANKILLGRLDYGAVGELVTVSFAQLEVELVDAKAVVDSIWSFTSGHPNVVQRLCHRLVNRLTEDGSDRRLRIADVQAVMDDPQFLEEDFLDTYWERASALEKILSLFLADAGAPLTIEALLARLRKEGVRAGAQVVSRALERLGTLRSLVVRDAGGYRIAVDAFPRVVARVLKADDLLLVLKDQHLSEPSEVRD